MSRRKDPKPSLAARIGEAIQLDEFRPGEWLRQIDLQQKFRATRFDVRMALDELVVRQAIQHVPNRGYRVAVLDATTLAGIREVREILECAAAPRIVARASAADVRELRRLAQAFSQAVRTGSHAEQSRANRAFHRAFYGLSGNPTLEEAIWALRDRARGMALTTWPSHAALEQSDREHDAILDALERRAADRLGKAIARHISRARKPAA